MSNYHKGVLYSYGGFTRGAIAKADKLGISCCILYAGSPPNLPDALVFSTYYFREQCHLTLNPGPRDSAWNWQTVLESTTYDDGTISAVEKLAQLFHADDDELRARLGTLPPPQRKVEVAVIVGDDQTPRRLILQTQWMVHRSRINAWLVNGSYSLTDKDFKGTMATPAIDTWSSDPGPGWESISLDQAIATNNIASIFLMTTDLSAVLRGWAAGQGQQP